MPLLDLSGNWTTNIDGSAGQLNLKMDADGNLTGDFGGPTQIVGKWDASRQRIIFMTTPLNDPNGASVYTGYLFFGVEVNPQGFGDIYTLGGTFDTFPGKAGGQGRSGGWYAKFLAFME